MVGSLYGGIDYVWMGYLECGRRTGQRGAVGSHYQQGGHQLEHGHKLELHRAPNRVAGVLSAIPHRLPQHPQCFVPQGLQRDGGAEARRGFCHSSSWQGSHKTGW